MDREKVAQTMESVVSSFRRQLAGNENSTLVQIGNMMKIGVESLKGSITGTEADKQAIGLFKQYADAFEDALHANDRAVAEKALDDLEKAIRAFRIKSDAVN